MRTSVGSIGIVLLVVACTEPPTSPVPDPITIVPASGATVVRGATEEQFSGLRFSCDGEPIDVEGTMTFRWHNTQLSSGHWQLSQQTRFKAHGTGLYSGLRYVHNAVFNETQIFAVPDGGAFTYDLVARAHGIVQGRADNDFFLIHAKWTINATGVVAVEFFDVEWDCRG
jgi:hypothetical protein